MASFRLRRFASSRAPISLITSAHTSRYLALPRILAINIASASVLSGIILFSQTLSQLRHEAQVVDGGEPEEERVVYFEQVVQVAKRVMRAAQAIAVGRNGRTGLDIFLIVGIDIREPLIFQPRRCIKNVQAAMAGIAGRHRAIENAIADTSTCHHILRMSNAQRVHRKLPWYRLSRTGDDVGEQVALVIERPSAITKAVETDFQ